jgi:hypothetical protein
MPDIDKNIIITPNRGATSQPNIVFTGQGVDPITVRVLDGTTGTGLTAGGAVSFEGSAGQLFSVVNRLGTGSIFSVNDISGIPSLDIDANGTVEIAPFTGYVGIGLTLPTEKLDISGTSRTRGLARFDSGISSAGGTFSGLARFLNGISANNGMTLYGTLRLATIDHSAGSGNLSIYNSPNARVSIGDTNSGGNGISIYLRDATYELNLINAFGPVVIGDPNALNSNRYISYDSTTGELGFGIVGGSITGADRVVAGAYQLSSTGIRTLSGTTYTLLSTDAGKVLTFNNGSTITVTIPTALPVGFSCTAIQLGAGQVGFTRASGVTLNSYGNQFKLIGQHAAATITEYAADTVNLSGNLIV